jgi:quercetin dioxygenase-like cupin family protein
MQNSAIAIARESQPPTCEQPCCSGVSWLLVGRWGPGHTALLRNDLVNGNGQEVIVWDTEYAPRAINPRHNHPSAITFYIVSGTGIPHQARLERYGLDFGYTNDPTVARGRKEAGHVESR